MLQELSVPSQLPIQCVTCNQLVYYLTGEISQQRNRITDYIKRGMNELEEKRRDVKQTRKYIDILIDAIKEQWSIGKIKAELSKAKYVPYKGRTRYYEMVEELLKEY